MDSSILSNEWRVSLDAEYTEDGEYLEEDTCAYSSADDEEEPDFTTKNPSLAPLITSNDAPQTAQLVVLREIRREHAVAILKGETELSEVDSALDALQARRSILLREQDVLYSEQEQCICLMSPIRRLPPEIVGEIFLYFAPVLRHNYDLHSTLHLPPPTEIPWYLGHISQYWRRVALSLRPLWSVFDFHSGRRSKALERDKVDFDWIMEAAEAAEKEREPDPSRRRKYAHDSEDRWGAVITGISSSSRKQSIIATMTHDIIKINNNKPCNKTWDKHAKMPARAHDSAVSTPGVDWMWWPPLGPTKSDAKKHLPLPHSTFSCTGSAPAKHHSHFGFSVKIPISACLQGCLKVSSDIHIAWDTLSFITLQ
ncbi:hypothetical protein C8R46DRAFT_1032105 [Mycena filopes]|nr:hypothetical protein C8R46DRAFT_1032105 [Mycena filopes]